ncbi:MAG: chromosome segregation protein SMC [Clostridia bacterium]|nr:chromosome segregation protein SMC [Clostridia bacterium]
MILKAIEMQGFKSFPEKTVLTFDRGITAVVGPNGSGKSNISDAVRWVLGEQSTKSLRGSKMEDVIFDGTGTRKAHGFAAVTLRLDNTDRAIPDPDEDEIVVTRRFFRSGESEYKVNGKTVRLKDLHALFMDTGLGRDGYSLVSQGKIADLIAGKGRECRDMLEEACGISAFRYRRSDAIKKLTQAEENLLRLRDILTELEDRIGPLKTQSEKAEKFLVLAAERKEVEIGLWLATIDRLKQNLRSQEDVIIIAETDYARAEAALEAIEAQSEAALSAAQTITTAIDDLRRSISLQREDAAKLDAQRAVMETSIVHNNETIERIEREKDASQKNREQLESEIAVEEGLLKQIDAILTEKRAAADAVRAKLAKADTADTALDSHAAELNDALSALLQQAADNRVASSTARSSLEEITLRLTALDEALAQQTTALDELLARQAEAEAAREGAEHDAEEKDNIAAGLALKAKKRADDADRLKKALDESAFDLQRKQAQTKMLEELEQNMEGYSGAVKAVIRRAKQGSLFGIHAAVSKLISMKPDYAVAIETALGAAVQHIVCDRESDAKAAIEYLKANALGRATFQPLSAVKPAALEETGLLDHDGVLGIAADLITYDPQYDSVMRALLGKTVITEDLDSAITLSKAYRHRFKVVTIDGQVIHTGGSMTGGSQAKTAGLLTRSSEIASLRETSAALETKVAKLKEDYAAAEAALTAIEAQAHTAQAALREAKETLILRQADVRLAEEQVRTSRAQAEALQADRQKELDRRTAQETARDAADETETELLQKQDDVKAKLLHLDEKRRTLLQEKEATAAALEKVNLEIHDGEKDRAARLTAMNLLKARLVSHEDRDREKDDEIAAIREKNAALHDTVKACETEAAALRKSADDKNEEILSLQTQRSESEAKSAALRAEQREKSAERERIGLEKARLEERREAMRRDYDDTVSKLYDDYQLSLREAQEAYAPCEEITKSKKRLAELKNKIRALGSVNVSAIDEYKEVSERYDFLSGQLSDVEKSKAELTRLISDLTDRMSTRFREQFSKINQYFDETFRELFDGGRAQLQLADPADVLESDIDIRLQPPGKNVKRLDALSGGEKGLSAIALLFAILKVNPAPFCIFDEVEAALDDANVGRYAQYVRRMTKNTQFILITHRRGTMEEADVLYGITMQEQGVSKLLELKTAELANRLGITT